MNGIKVKKETVMNKLNHGQRILDSSEFFINNFIKPTHNFSGARKIWESNEGEKDTTVS